MKTGICWITFKEGLEDSQIQKLISKFYLENQPLIVGMEFNQLEDKTTLKEARKIVSDLFKEGRDVAQTMESKNEI